MAATHSFTSTTTSTPPDNNTPPSSKPKKPKAPATPSPPPPSTSEPSLVQKPMMKADLIAEVECRIREDEAKLATLKMKKDRLGMCLGLCVYLSMSVYVWDKFIMDSNLSIKLLHNC